MAIEDFSASFIFRMNYLELGERMELLRKTVSGIMLTLLLIGMLTLAFNMQPVRGSGTIYIRADGSIDPTSAPIERDGDVYIFTGDIYDSIVVERDNITIDGNGHLLQGAGSWYGIELSGRRYVTIKNVQIKSFDIGVYLSGSLSNTIIGNNITANNSFGIELDSSSNYNTIIGNNITANNFYGIGLDGSSNNTIARNTVTANNYDGIELDSSSNYNTIIGNNITANGGNGGIGLYSSSNNNIIRNNITANDNRGIYLTGSNNNIIGNNITANDDEGVYLSGFSNYNTIIGNDIAAHTYYGISLSSSSNNKFYHNNFINNRACPQVHSYRSVNVWDDGYPSGGNYWSDYAGIDKKSGPNQDQPGSDGIGDTPYIINADNRDRYPLMNPWPARVESPWPMFQHDAQRTGRSPYAGPQTNSLKWVFATREWSNYKMFSSAIGRDGIIYLTAQEGLYAIYPDGTLNWLYETPWAIGTPSIDRDGNIYIISDYFGPKMRMLSIRPDGSLRWSLSLGSRLDLDPSIGNDGRLYIIVDDYIFPDGSVRPCLVAIDPGGTVNCLYEIEEPPYISSFSSTAIGSDGIIYFGYNRTLFAINPDGTKKWSISFSNTPSTPSISSGGMIYVSIAVDKLYAISPDGQIVWSSKDHPLFHSPHPPLISPDGSLYVVGGYTDWTGAVAKLFAFDSQCNLKWSTWIDVYCSVPIIDAEGVIYVTSLYDVRALYPDGSVRWGSTGVNALSARSLALGADGTLYVPAGPGLYAFGPGTAPPPEDLPPTCVIKLLKGGVEIDEVDVWEFFDIYVGDSTDDTGIKEVRFSSDDVQDGIPTGEWTEWYDWDVSSEDWDAATKIKRWSFATSGKKEVWAEVKDEINQTSNCSSNIRATVNGKSTEFSAGDCVKIQKYSLLYKEPRLDSESHYIYEDKCGRIMENENNGIFADGHFWWYVKVELFEYWVWEEAIIKNQPPIPSLNYAPKHPKANEEVIFDASESQDPDGKIKFYKWYLNGKFKGMTENPIMFYVFEKEGTFSLKVEVIDDCLESASIEVTVKVEGKTRPEKIKKIISKDDLIKIADDLGIPHYTVGCGLWCQREYFELNGETYSQEELLGVLNKLIKKISETGELDFLEDVVYGMEIRNILEDAKLVDLTSRATWDPQKDDFKNLKKTNTWAETILKLANWEAPLLEQFLKRVAFLLELPQLHVAGALIGPILKIAEGYRVYKKLDFLEDILYKRALWHYLQLRIGGEDSVTAFGCSPVPIEYNCIETRESWEKLYETYKPYIMPGQGGLGENFGKIKADLRKHVYDIIDSYSLMPLKFVRIGSVGELRVYDSEGRVTGLVKGEIREEIPYSMYDEETETITIFPAIDSYYYKILGIDEGTYGLEITSVEYENTTTFTATDIPISTNAIHEYAINWTALSLGEEGVNVQIDSDGDGVFEHTFTSDSELTQQEYVIATDKTAPKTTLSIGEPKYVTERTYVTPDTPFMLEATDDAGSGVYSTAYRIYDDTYDSGWLTYATPFNMTGLNDDVYTIEFNSTDYAGNIEATKSIQVTLFSWNYVFEDSYGRGTILKINTEHKFFQFITPDGDYGIRKATRMQVYRARFIIIQHRDDELRLITLTIDTKLDFCVAIAWDVETSARYFLIDKPGKE
jgi:parallel beta-helix repeat protein